MSLNGFVRAAGAAMGMARESFGTGGGVSLAPPPGLGPPPGQAGAGSGAAAAGFSRHSSRVSTHVRALADHDAAGVSGLDAAVASAGASRGRMDAVIASAIADVQATGVAVNTPAGQQALVAAIKRHLEETKLTLDQGGGEAATHAAAANVTAAGYQGIGSPPGGQTPMLPQLPMGGGFPLSGGMLSPLTSLSGLLGGGGLGGLAGLPTSLMGSGFGGAGGAVDSAGGVVGRSVGGELGPGVASEKGLQRDTILAARAVSAAFPEIRTIGGVRPDSLKWHPNGQAIDVMIPDPTSARGKALGDAVMRFAMAHRGQFNINHVIWQQTIHNPDGSSSLMENRGSPTANHMDHVHIATNGGGFPHGGEVYRL